MDELTLTLIGAVINGVALMLGLVIGTKLTGNTIEKAVNRIMAKSPIMKKLQKIMESLDNEKALEEIMELMRAGAALLKSPEAKQFFANVTELMKEFSTEKTNVKLKMPKKEDKD